ncbi:MAG: type III pantothenate kinase [Aquificaceae bacterium]|nr:type III pantothenate kinase [Aquificaceae bacterium]
MKVLTLDVGNTSVDVCLFEKELLYLGKFLGELPYFEADVVLVSSVKPSVEGFIRDRYPKAKFVKPEEVPLKTAFEGKERVGVDRLLNLYGAVSLYGEDLVVVSAGTALVVDLCLDGVFQGGFITLGIGSGLKCLHQRAELIPEVKPRKLSLDIGTNTEEAILGGFINQAVFFLKGCVESWKRKYGRELKVILTGGDGWLLEELGFYDPLLPHRAMLSLLSP